MEPLLVRRINVRRSALPATMTFLTQEPHLAADQHAVIDRPVRHMAGQAFIVEQPTLSDLDVLEDERPLLVGMTPQTHGAQPADRFHRLREIDRSVLLVAIAALHAPFRHLVMIGLAELGANFAMTVVA